MHEPAPPYDLGRPGTPDRPVDGVDRADGVDGADAERLRRDLAVQAAGVGSFDWDLQGGTFSSDERFAELFGYDPFPGGPVAFAGTRAEFSERVHPQDLEALERLVADAVRGTGDLETEFRIRLPDGSLRWMAGRGRVFADADGRPERLLGVAYDTTREHTAQNVVSLALQAMPAAFYALDRAGRFRHVNAEAERLLARSSEQLLGTAFDELFGGADGAVVRDVLRSTATTGRASIVEVRHPEPLDLWCELRVWPDPDGLSVLLLPTAARRAAEEAALRASARVQVVAEVGAHLSSTLDVETAVARLADHLVPVLGDWCIVTLVDEQGQLHDIGTHHHDPAAQEVLEAYAAARLPSLSSSVSYVSQASATGRPALLPEPAVDHIVAVLGEGAAAGHARALAPRSAVVLPLVARGRTIGLVTLARGAARASLDAEDLATAVAVSERAALALDNARLYGQQQRLAEGLQRDLLTPPAQSDRLEIAVRYQPAAEVAQVGGDWYDAFQQPDGATMLAIGDVVGHDVSAAAAMSQLRNLLRGMAFATTDAPAAVLSRLDAAMAGLQVGTLATALVGRLAPSPLGDGEVGGGGVWFQFSSAGHPAPVLITADGVVAALDVAVGGEGHDLLLGIDPATARHDGELLLRAGDTVLLHTDGLVERRDQSLDVGTARLLEAVRGGERTPLEQLCDDVLAGMLPEDPDDDVALLVVRVR